LYKKINNNGYHNQGVEEVMVLTQQAAWVPLMMRTVWFFFHWHFFLKVSIEKKNAPKTSLKIS